MSLLTLLVKLALAEFTRIYVELQIFGHTATEVPGTSGTLQEPTTELTCKYVASSVAPGGRVALQAPLFKAVADAAFRSPRLFDDPVPLMDICDAKSDLRLTCV